MRGRRGGAALVVAALGLALAVLLAVAREAEANREYVVAQCGWHVGRDADWADTTGGTKFRHDAWCGTAPGDPPIEGVHMKSLTRDAGAVAGTRFARWRWQAPEGTGITRVTGTWWHVLRGGMEQRIGVVGWNGDFSPFRQTSSVDPDPKNFGVDFNQPKPALEDRLLCARGESRWCDIDPGSWSSIRALVLTIDDGHSPIPSHAEGDLARDGWRRGTEEIELRDRDVGGGVRYGEVLIDGELVGRVEYDCGTARIDGELRGISMRPCPERGEEELDVRTDRLHDGKHALKRCATDFAGNRACRFPEVLRTDNNPPGSPRGAAVEGGGGWHRENEFDVAWDNPDQDGASPIAAAHWRLTGPGGRDSGRKLAEGRGRDRLADLSVPRAGAYELRVWLRDEAGNSDSGTAARVVLRLDDVDPGVAFELRDGSGDEPPRAVRASVVDEHSGPAGGRIALRRRGTEKWRDLSTELRRGERGDGEATLRAALPDEMRPGVYVLRATGRDAAGNSAQTTRRSDGTEMTLRVTAPGSGAGGAAGSGRGAPGSRGAPGRPGARGRRGPGSRARVRVLAGLHWRLRRGARIAVPLGARPRLFGRLLTAAGRGLPRRRLRIVSRPAPGVARGRRAHAVRTGRNGRFRVTLPPGASRRLAVGFGGTARLRPARRGGLALRVRAAASLGASPRRLRTGQVVRLHGRVRPPAAARRRAGKLIAIQYLETAARRWRPVLFTRADRQGRFRARYRFRYLDGTARIRLRALVPAEARWPYATGASRPVVIEVRG